MAASGSRKLWATKDAASPMDVDLRAERKQEGDKPSAAGETVGKGTVARPVAPQAGLGQQPVRTPYTGPVLNRAPQNPKSKPNPGVTR